MSLIISIVGLFARLVNLMGAINTILSFWTSESLFSLSIVGFFTRIFTVMGAVNTVLSFWTSESLYSFEVHIPAQQWFLLIIGVLYSLHSRRKFLINFLENDVPGFTSFYLGPISLSTPQIVLCCRWTFKKLGIYPNCESRPELDSSETKPFLGGIEYKSYDTMEAGISYKSMEPSPVNLLQDTAESSEFLPFDLEIKCEQQD